MEYKLVNYESSDWNRIILKLPNHHILQSWEWGALKSKYSWRSEQLVWHKNDRIVAAAMVLKRSLEIPLVSKITNILYIPKGPLLDWNDTDLRNQVIRDVYDYARRNQALFVKIDPDVIIGSGIPGRQDYQTYPLGDAVRSTLKYNNWQYSGDQVQFQNTLLIDLAPSEDALLANMKQKTRYNVRLASRRGVKIRRGNSKDIGLMYKMYAETSLRDGFTIRSEEYYTSVWGTFIQDKLCNESLESNRGLNFQPVADPLIAEVDGEPIAAVIIFRFGGKAWYMYGMSREVHREKMPNYLLQWEAIKLAKEVGCHIYDLWGAPDNFNEDDPLWGVYRFKEGLGGQAVQSIGAWDLPIRPVFYTMYTSILPRILELMRIRGKSATKSSLLE